MLYEIPYRCSHTDKYRKLLVWGRCMSADFVVQSAIRIRPTCKVTGEAVGIAAAIACVENKPVQAADVHGIRQIMMQWGGTFID